MNKFACIASLCLVASVPVLFTPAAAGAAAAPSIQSFYEGSKAGKVIDLVGDSTTEAAPALYERITRQYAASGGPLEGAVVHNLGTSGNTLHNFVNDVSANGNTLSKAIQEDADLYILSYGINDIRGGEDTEGSSPEQIKSDLKLAVDKLLKETRGAVLLRTPNPFLSKNVSKTIYLTPIENAQLYSDQLWEVYDSFEGYDDRVDVLDIPNLVFGRKSMPEHPLMNDILHPNDDGYRAIADALVDRITGKTKPREVQAESFTQLRQVSKTITTLKDERLYDEMPGGLEGNDLRPRAVITPQTLQVTAQKGEFYKVKTWLGDKWINPVGGALETVPGTSAETLQLKADTYAFDNPYTANAGQDAGFFLAPQSVQVLARWHGFPYWKNEWFYYIKTVAGPKWINERYALPSDVKPIQETVELNTVTELKKYPWEDAYTLGSITPQKVSAFEKGNGWYHIRSWAGDAWIHSSAAHD